MWTVTRAGARLRPGRHMKWIINVITRTLKKGNVFSLHFSGFKSQTRLNKERAKRTAAVDRKVDRVEVDDRKVDRVPGDARGGGGGECQHRLLIMRSSVQECYRC